MHRFILLPFATLLCLSPIGCGGNYMTAGASAPGETFAAGHLVVVYRDGAVPADARALATQAGARSIAAIPRLGIATIQVEGDESGTIAQLLANPEVAAVLHDRIVSAHIVGTVGQIATSPASPDAPASPVAPSLPAAPAPHVPIAFPTAPSAQAADFYYDSPQGWAVQDAGGFGDSIPGGPTVGPWNTSRGAGVRIAVLDSGVDQNHPDIAPNLALNLSEVDQTALPSACDNGSPQDQQGHGTFSASLATAAIGGGGVIGVAPQASLLNIKVLERLPATTGATLTAQCEAGEASGLLSWVLLGLSDAIAQRANVVSLSLGTLVDTSTGDGAGWQAQFNAATYAAQQAGVTIVAALGNDGLNLSTGTLVELPAQSRGVLPVVASTNPECAEDLTPNAPCAGGPVTRASYSDFGVAGAIAAPGGSYPQGSTTSGVSGFVRGACSNGLANTSDGLPGDGGSFGCFGLGHTQYVQAIGTSAAAPLAAGAAAILIAAHPNWSAAQVTAALRSSATPLTTLAEPLVNLAGALALP
jgi:subtilisin family serine protease